MPRLAANLSMMFTELPFLERFDAAARAGFQACEFLFPYDHPAAELRRRLDAAGLIQALFNAPPGDWPGGERGLASLPGRQAEFRDAIARGLDYAHTLSCPLLHVMAGIPAPGTPRDLSASLYAANLAWAAERAAGSGVRLVLEPINGRDMPGYFLDTQEQGAAVVEALGRDRLGLQFDVYHCQTAQGDVTTRMATLMPVIAHMQIADVPGRHEPGTGEVGWEHVFGRMDALGYAGWVGCEYRPAGETLAGLGWRQRFGL